MAKTVRRARVAWWVALFVLPALLLYASLVLVPIGIAAALSLFDWDGSGPMTFIGLENWVTFFGDQDALASVQRTALLVIASWVVQVPIAMAIGIYAAGTGRHRAVLSSIFFIPALMSAAAMGVLWGQLFSPVGGGVTYAAEHFGLFFLSPDWLGDPQLVLATIVALIAWQYVPFHALLFRAGVSQIPRSIYEAAAIDGVSGPRRFWSVTLPMLRHTIVTSTILNIVGSLTIFDLIYVLTQGGPGQSSRVLALAQYLEGFTAMRFGYASTLAVVLGALAITFSLIMVRVTGFGKMKSQAEGV